MFGLRIFQSKQFVYTWSCGGCRAEPEYGTRGCSAGRLPGGYSVRYALCTEFDDRAIKPLIGRSLDFSQSTD